MKLKMRHTMRRSREQIENDFNPINLDYIFNEEDVLAPWLEETEAPLLDGTQNAEWLPREDSEDEGEIGGNNSSPNQTTSGSDNRGLSPPSDGNQDDDDDDDGSGGNTGGDDGRGGRGGRHGYRTLSSINEGLDYGLDMSRFRGDADYGSSSSTRRDQSLPTRRRHHQDISDASSSSGMTRSLNDTDFGESSQHSQGYFPPHSFQPPFMNYPSHPPHAYYPNAFQQQDFNYPSHYPQPQIFPSSSMSYNEQPNENATPGLFGYIFGQGDGYQGTGGEGEDSSFDPPRNSTMW